MSSARLPLTLPLALILCLAGVAPAAADQAPPRLVGAAEVDPPGRYPFAAALVDRHLADAWRGRFCDGSLVAGRWVLTAARCLDDRRPADVEVVIGRHDLTTTEGHRVAVVAFHVHPRHDGADLYDAALVELAEAVAADPVGLPAADLPPGPAVVTGWGDTLTPNRLPRELQQAEVPLLPDTDCARAHGNDFAAGSMVCAGDLERGGVGACRGDRGAPLFVAGPDGPVQVGVAGWGVGCALPGLPALYTRVSSLTPWVQSVTGTGPFSCAGRAPTLLGTPGVDVLVGTGGDDVIVALGGRDLIDGGGGNDLICAGEGDDQVSGGEGHDVIYGEAGDDVLRGGSGDDRLHGGDGADGLIGEEGNNHLEGGPGDDTLVGGGGNDRLDGGADADLLSAGRGRDALNGGPGDDVLRAGPGPDVLRGGPGRDVLHGRAGDDRLHGGRDADRLIGGSHSDRLYGGPGDDFLGGGAGSDLLQGDSGADELRGGPGEDLLNGGEGPDRGGGGPGADTCLLEQSHGCEA